MPFLPFKDSNRSVIHRKSSLALTPEDEPLEIFVSIFKFLYFVCYSLRP
ncbi:unnamed protein product [Callosobruchus maculatus]|uniref:Uncharacterized protein n=1 Tax=Callosobruchus maculatus TaxID=64391 RepID=A0A653C463_CALMS|nr:unnamed protein product [Callosobruchus maculatus]